MGTRMGQPGGRKKDKKLMDPIMPESYRPIAPKPLSPRSIAAAAAMLSSYVRPKRRYIKRSKPFRKNNSIVKKGRRKRDLPSTPAGCGGGGGSGVGSSDVGGSSTLSICAPVHPHPPPPPTNKTAGNYPTVWRNPNPPRRVVVESRMTVHSMEETVPDNIGGGLLIGNTDNEKIMNLQNDTCPVLVSDSEQRVIYTNLAYNKMAAAGGGVQAEEEEAEEGGGRRPLMSIVLKHKIPDTWTEFTCIGRVEYYIQGMKKHTQSMPCDVWRMDFGGFLWRLDLEVALKLGR